MRFDKWFVFLSLALEVLLLVSCHLLAWYNGGIGKASYTAGLYRYDLSKKILTQVMPLSTLGVATLFSAQNEVPLLLSMRYNKGQLYYLVVTHPFEQKSLLAIYRHSVVQPVLPSTKIVEIGSEPWFNEQQSGPFVMPGWDISQDGEQLIAQMILAAGPTQATASIQAIDLESGSTTTLFTQALPQMLAHDLSLSWGPDSQAVVATEDHMQSQHGPYSATLADPAVMQQYTPNLAGQVAWRADSKAFVVQSAETTGAADAPDIYVFTTGESHGRLLLTDAQDFVWG